MRDNPGTKGVGHDEEATHPRADRDAPPASGSRRGQRQIHPAGVQRGGDYRANVLPVAERIRGPEAGPGETAERAREGKLPVETCRRGAVPGEANSAGGGPGKLLSPDRRRQAVTTAQQRHGISERQACRLLGQWRGTQRYRPTHRDDEEPLTRAIVTLASQYGRYGYRRITALLRPAGWSVGHDRVERIWRREGL